VEQNLAEFWERGRMYNVQNLESNPGFSQRHYPQILNIADTTLLFIFQSSFHQLAHGLSG
jgi:hypothetical protein